MMSSATATTTRVWLFKRHLGVTRLFFTLSTLPPLLSPTTFPPHDASHPPPPPKPFSFPHPKHLSFPSEAPVLQPPPFPSYPLPSPLTCCAAYISSHLASPCWQPFIPVSSHPHPCQSIFYTHKRVPPLNLVATTPIPMPALPNTSFIACGGKNGQHRVHRKPGQNFIWVCTGFHCVPYPPHPCRSPHSPTLDTPVPNHIPPNFPTVPTPTSHFSSSRIPQPAHLWYCLYCLP
jgi:hypothetical protein